jgi:hypothetical protein
MAIISEPERTKFYQKVRHLLGAPLRSVELEDEMMDTLLEYSIDDYSQYVQDWLTESQWTSLYNLNLDIIPVSGNPVDRRLGTIYPDINEMLWKNAGYSTIPTIEELIRELKEYTT